MRAIRLSLAFILISAGAFAALHFPELTGRVVDAAHLLSPAILQTLGRTLADYEETTGNQLVVVTLQSLEGDAIEDYSFQLGRYWGIGQKKENNGILFIVAPHERKVRIETGYGIEAKLTDAQSSQIIRNIITPAFKAGDMQKGIVNGVQAIISTIGDERVSASTVQTSNNQNSGYSWVWILIFLFLVIPFIARHPFLAMMLLNNSTSRFGSSRIDSGWGGGGGSFGGGGSSGSW